MEFIFLVYGLAFFILGFAILYYPKKGSAFHLAKEIHFVGWFGIIHGINEWLDLLIMMNALNASSVWETFRLATLPVSFLTLVCFGARVISTQKKNCCMCKFFTPVLMVLWGILFFAGEHSQHKWDILSRYILCLPGALLTGLALFVYVPETESTRNFRLTINLKIAGAAFIAYAFLAGLIVRDDTFFLSSILNYSLFSKSIGVPVQVFRSLCAIIIAYNLVRVLEVFHLEMQQSVLDNQMRFRTVVNTAPVALFIEDKNHTITFFEGKGLAGLNFISEDVVGKPAAEVFADVSQIPQDSIRAVENDEEFTDLISSQGRFYEVFFAPLKDQNGTILGAIGVATDVSEQKNARRDLERYRAEMEKNKTLAAVGALSTEIAGQITAPLYDAKIVLLKAFGGLRKTIGAGDVKADIQAGIDLIATATKLLDGFCKKADLKTPPPKEPIDLYLITERVLSVLQDAVKQAMVRISTQETGLFPALNISSKELEQILYIMVQSVISMVDGTHVHNLDIEFSTQDEVFRVRFSETCLSDSVHEAAQVSTISPEKFSETGKRSFDFSILKGMVEGSGGSVTVTQNQQGGVLYEIELPLAK
ncbi:MAG: PAS domain-containing protein [Phycisphaerae bacterium]|nr:PAS domain-containing protein [Phycisphaerae bacterium]